VLSPATESIPIFGPPQSIYAPAGGAPAAITSLPGLGPVAAFAGASSTIPGQVATFASAPLTRSLTIAGVPTATVTVRSSTGRATLFAAVEDLSPSTGASLPAALVAPLSLSHIPPTGTTVTVALPGIVRTIPAGDRLALVISTTNAGYLLPSRPATYTVASGASLILPMPATTVVGAPPARSRRLAAGALAVATGCVIALGALRARRRRRDDVDVALAEVPIATTGLGKRYRTGVRAVSDVSLRVGAGQVVGLLGPNGAGKTSTLRMLVGLMSPSEGQVRIYGHLLRPGHPVLSRLGVLIEGPGLLPHLTGRANLAAAWAASGRPHEQAQFETVLEVAGLGDDIDRTVRTYSQGMRQRLAIAQAMLGLPEVLVLDEPTNGLDPQQIGEMRQMLRTYAATGRTVLVSSHLLAEVEATCTHVAVMSAGKLVASGTVAEIVARASTMVIDVTDRDAARHILEQRGLSPTETDTGLRVGLGAQPRGDVLASLVSAGVSVTRFAPEHGLEEAFLDLVGGN
jgi:ABC-2 type transport system ATP-binding protein